MRENRKAPNNSRRTAAKRFKNAVAMLLLFASIMSLGGFAFAFAAEPEQQDTPVVISPAEPQDPQDPQDPDEETPSQPSDKPQDPDKPQEPDKPQDPDEPQEPKESEEPKESDPPADPVPSPADPVPSPADPLSAPADPNAAMMPVALGLDDPDAPEGEGEPAPLALEDNTVYFYVAVNGVWKNIGSAKADGAADFNGTTRAYVTLSTIAPFYEPYGFDAESYNGERCFPHNNGDTTDTPMWANAEPKMIDGTWCIPVAAPNHGFHNVFYVPNNDGVYAGNGSVAANDTNLLAKNDFYSVEVSSAGLTPAESVLINAPTGLVLAGSEVTVTVPKLDGGWNVSGGDEAYTETQNEEANTVTYTINSIASNYSFTPKKVITIEYDAEVEHMTIGQGVTIPTKPKDGDKGTINGQEKYTDSADIDSEYRLLNVDNDVVNALIYVKGNDEQKPTPVKYTFVGWKLGDGDTAIVKKPRETLSAADVSNYAENGVLKLKAVWTPFIENGKGVNFIATANFFVGLDIEIHGTNYDYQTKEPQNFTFSTYSTRVLGVPRFENSEGESVIVKNPNAENNAAVATQSDLTIRNLIHTEFNGVKFEDGMPSDEKIFSALRAGTDTILLDKQPITPQMRQLLTPDRFAVRWYVLKYHGSDGYHVDGVICARPGTLIVQKTFSGDSDAIDAVKKNFSISVEHDETHLNENGENVPKDKHIKDYVLTINKQFSVDDYKPEGTKTIGYKSYDPASNTYTWEIEGFQGVDYQILETGYELPEEFANQGITRESTYSIINRKDGTDITRASYEACLDNDPQTKDGVIVNMRSYDDNTADSAKQTVAFNNSYTKPGVITVFKRDEVADKEIRGVSFTLKGENGEAVALYQKPNKAEYSTEQDDEYTASAEAALTDAHGHFFLKLRPGTYTLVEKIPGGYFGARTTTFTVDGNNKIQGSSIASGDVSEGAPSRNEPWASVDANGTTLTVFNVSSKFDVTVKNTWINATDAEKKDVVIELWRNGAFLDGYSTVLAPDGEHTWTNMPLFVNGSVAQYSVKVAQIGEIYYSDILAVTDGYTDYSISRDAPQFTNSSDKTEVHAEAYWKHKTKENSVIIADHLLLGVNISPINSVLNIKKHADSVNGAGLPGAEYTLAYDESFAQTVDVQLVSGEGGVIELGTIKPGEYYLKETKAPAGYALDTAIYKVKVTDGRATVTLHTKANGEAVSADEPNLPITDLVNKTELEITVNNKSIYGDALTGGKIALYKTDENGGEELLESLEMTTADGQTRTFNQGTYRLKQTVVADGYVIYETAYDFKVDNGQAYGIAILRTLRLMGRAAIVHAEGYDMTGSAADGFTITLYNKPVEAPESPSGSPSTSPDSSPSGSPSTPPDSSTSPKPSPTTTPTLTPAPGRWYNPYNYGGLPQTGQVNWPVPVLIILGVALCVAGAALMKKRGKK